MTEEEMGAERRGSTMTAELAILRELAFRRKVFQLQSKRDDDLEKEEPVQSPSPSMSPSPNPNPNPSPQSSSSPRLSGMKRPTPSSSVERLSPRPLQSFGNHSMNANQTEHIFCSTCNVPCPGIFNHKQHLEGRKHKAKLLEMKLQGNNVGLNGKVANQRWCDLCNTGCTSEELFQLHLNGKRHKAELQRAQCARKGGAEIANQQKWCEMCDVWCPNEDAFKMHLDGKNHIFRLHDNEKKRRAGNMGSCSGMA